MSNLIITKQKVEIPLSEYNLLREFYRYSKKQILLMRIIEAEDNLKKKRVKKVSVKRFIKDI